MKAPALSPLPPAVAEGIDYMVRNIETGRFERALSVPPLGLPGPQTAAPPRTCCRWSGHRSWPMGRTGPTCMAAASSKNPAASRYTTHWVELLTVHPSRAMSLRPKWEDPGADRPLANETVLPTRQMAQASKRSVNAARRLGTPSRLSVLFLGEFRYSLTGKLSALLGMQDCLVLRSVTNSLTTTR